MFYVLCVVVQHGNVNVRKLFTRVDSDNNGKLNFKEFVVAVRKHGPPYP